MPKIPTSSAWWLSPLDRAKLIRQGITEVDALTEYKVDEGAGTRVSWGQPAGTPRSLIERKELEVERTQESGLRRSGKSTRQPK